MRGRILGIEYIILLVIIFIIALVVITQRMADKASAAMLPPPTNNPVITIVEQIPQIESARSDTWTNIYFFILESNSKVFPRLAEIYTDSIIKQSERHGLNPAIVVSLMKVESGFDYLDVSSENAKGLLQIVHNQWSDFPEYSKVIRKESDLFDPELNIEAACVILKELKKRNKGNARKYINAYLGATGHYEKVMTAYGNFKLSSEEG